MHQGVLKNESLADTTSEIFEDSIAPLPKNVNTQFSLQARSEQAPQGGLDELLAVIDESAVNNAIKLGACNVYHGCVHNMLFDKNKDMIK